MAVTFDAPEGAGIPSLAGLPGVNHEIKSGNGRRLYTDSPGDVIPAVVDFAREHKLRITSLNTLGPSLEDVFLKITGQEVGAITAPSKGEGKRKKGGMGR